MTAKPRSPKRNEPSNLLLGLLFILFLLLIYAIFRGEEPTPVPQDSIHTMQSSAGPTGTADPFITASGQLKPRINPDPVESVLIDIMDPGQYSMMEVPQNSDVVFDQKIDAVVALRAGVPGSSRWKIQRIKKPVLVNTGGATHLVYWTFPSMSVRDIDARMAAAMKYLQDAGVLE